MSQESFWLPLGEVIQTIYAGMVPALELVNCAAHTADDEGNTLLHHAVISGNLPAAKEVINIGALVDARNHDGLTPLHVATNCASVSMARLLVAHGASVLARTGRTKRTPLHLAFTNDEFSPEQIPILDLLIQNNAEIEAVDSSGSTPLICHLTFGPLKFYPPLLTRLVAAGVNLNAKNRSGNTPLHVVCVRALSDFCPAILEILIRNGADSTIRNNNGFLARKYLQNAVKENRFMAPNEWESALMLLGGS